MRKEYKINTMERIFSLGLKRYGVEITSEEIVLLGLLPKRMLIDSIVEISYESRSVPAGKTVTSSFFYVIKNNQGKELVLPYLLLDGAATLQELFRDLRKLNPKIILSEELEWFLSVNIEKRKLKFDFTVHKGDHVRRRREQTHLYPSLVSFIWLTVIFHLIATIALFGGLGDYLLTQRFGADYHWYRIVAVSIGGLGFFLATTNLLISLASMYLGHKWTIRLLIITIIGLCVGFV